MECGCKSLELPVAFVVPIAVVDKLKAVHVDAHDGKICGSRVEYFKNTLAFGAVVNPCQRISVSNFLQQVFLGFYRHQAVRVNNVTHDKQKDE